MILAFLSLQRKLIPGGVDNPLSVKHLIVNAEDRDTSCSVLTTNCTDLFCNVKSWISCLSWILKQWRG